MIFGAFSKTWQGSLVENKWNRIFNGCLSVAVVILTYLVATKDQIVVIKPETLGSEAWITKNSASESYKESWGLYLAQLTGNITPANVVFIEERLKPLLSPAIYSDIIDTLQKQALDIQNDRVTMRFEPRFVEYENTTDKVFVYGYSFVQGATGDPERTERTYEYKIKISHYAPMILDLNTYEGKPRTERVLLELEKEDTRRNRDE